MLTGVIIEITLSLLIMSLEFFPNKFMASVKFKYEHADFFKGCKIYEILTKATCNI